MAAAGLVEESSSEVPLAAELCAVLSPAIMRLASTDSEKVKPSSLAILLTAPLEGEGDRATEE
jgi:hypothetical protein